LQLSKQTPITKESIHKWCGPIPTVDAMAIPSKFAIGQGEERKVNSLLGLDKEGVQEVQL